MLQYHKLKSLFSGFNSHSPWRVREMLVGAGVSVDDANEITRSASSLNQFAKQFTTKQYTLYDGDYRSVDTLRKHPVIKGLYTGGRPNPSFHEAGGWDGSGGMRWYSYNVLHATESTIDLEKASIPEPYFGFELETNRGDGDEAVRVMGADTVIYKEDSSTGPNGYEIVGTPMTLEETMKRVVSRDIDQFMPQDNQGYEERDCHCDEDEWCDCDDGSEYSLGLHIHVSTAAMTARSFVRFHHLFNAYPTFWGKLSGRDSLGEMNSWATFRLYNSEKLATHFTRQSGSSDDRYSAVNYSFNRKTAELRFFGAPKCKDEFAQSIQLAHAAWAYSKRGSGYNLHLPTFVAFIKENKEKYPNVGDYDLDRALEASRSSHEKMFFKVSRTKIQAGIAEAKPTGTKSLREIIKNTREAVKEYKAIEKTVDKDLKELEGQSVSSVYIDECTQLLALRPEEPAVATGRAQGMTLSSLREASEHIVQHSPIATEWLSIGSDGTWELQERGTQCA